MTRPDHHILPAIVREQFPQLNLPPRRIRHEQGQFNDIYIVDEVLVFRFPRYETALRTLEQEARLLATIQPHLPLPVPGPLYTGRNWHTLGEAFIGYPLLPGEPLWRETLSALDQATQQHLARQLAGFLRVLHALPTALLEDDRPVMDTVQEWTELYAAIRRDLFPLMRVDARQEVAAHFEATLARPEAHSFRPVIRHGDFGSSNILYNPRAREISGILDFSSAGYGDPATDLAAVSTYGASFFTLICDPECGGYPLTEDMLARVHFYRGTFALQEALHGYRHGDQEALQNGLSTYV